MNETSKRILFSMLRAVLKGTPLSDTEPGLSAEESFSEVLDLAQKHDLAHLICTSLLENKLVCDDTRKYQALIYKTVYRYERQSYELDRIRDILERAQVPFIALKGSVLRKYYKEPWMRTSCDIDVLVKPEDLSNAQNAIVQEGNYTYNEKSSHDVSLRSPTGVCLELHFALNEPNFRESALLTDVWNSEHLVRISDFEYGMGNELFLFYHIYHMAKHFVHGGCGIKALIDLWIIKHQMGYKESVAVKLLQENNLLDFYKQSLALAEVWFDGKAHTSITQDIEDYVLQGGVYGTLEQQLAISQSQKGNGLKHLLSKIFLSYKAMCIYYPSLKKHPILFPFYQVRRWFRIAFCGGRERALREIKLNQNLSQIKKENAKRLLDELGLEY